MSSRDTKMQRRRIKEGLCGRCGVDRGEEGTTTMCRPCAEKQNKKVMQYKRNFGHGYVTRTCDNCFKPFKGNKVTREIFCEACSPWFEIPENLSAIHHQQEQEQAMKVEPDRLNHIVARNIVNDWLKQG